MARYALVIGITQNQSHLQTLEKSAADARAIAAVLRDFGDFQVELLLKPEETTYKALAAKLKEFLELRALRHEALIYYTGHGFPVSDAFGEMEAFLAPSDCVVQLDPDGHVIAQEKGLSLTAVSKLAARAELSNLVMLLDCCHSGYLLEESLLKQTFITFIQKDYWLMTACRSFQSAYAKRSDLYSIFTGAILAGLNRDRANERGEIMVGALFNYVEEALRGERQEVMQLSVGRQTWLVRYPLSKPEPVVTVDETNPYQSLNAFTPETAKYFFGREPEIQKLVQQVQDCNFVPVIGASGSGKSSLVRAGLIPRLVELGWRVLEPIKPGVEPLVTLKLAVGDLFETAEREEIYGVLDRQGLGAIASHLPGNDRVILVVDQFEEVFTLCQDRQQQRRFIDCLTSVKQLENCRFVVVTTMRADFVEPWLTSGVLTQAIQNDALFLGVLAGENLEEAIEKPSIIQGYNLQPGLLDLILRDVANEDNCLPLLEFALTELWEKRGRVKHELTVDDYKALGGLVGALDRHAEEIYQDLAARGQGEWVQRVMLRLVKTGEGMKDTRQRRSQAELLAMGADIATREKIEKTINRLVGKDARLLTIDAEKIIDLSHEALMVGWKRFVEWREIDREFRVWHGQLQESIKKWQKNNHSKSFLLNNEEILLAKQWLKDNEEKINKSEQKFIKDSEKEKNNIARNFTIGICIFAVMASASAYAINRFAICPFVKGKNGENTNGVCFRDLKTSGDKNLFLSSTNLDLEEGVELFRKENYAGAKLRFNRAHLGDRSDPVPMIFASNAEIFDRDKKLNSKHLKLAVVTSIDSYEIGAKEVLRGIADAQVEFNENQKKLGTQYPLLEIEIVNDENELEVARKVSQELIDDSNLIGIIGHYSSESTVEAMEKVYQNQNIAVVSSTSASSSLEKYKNFFRTVQSTKESAIKYVDVAKKMNLNSDNTAIFYSENSEYSRKLKEDFLSEFTKGFNVEEDKNKMRENTYEIEEIEDYNHVLKSSSKKAVLIISSVKTNSIAVAIAKKIKWMSKNKNSPNLLLSMALSESEIQEKVGSTLVREMTMIRPCVSTGSTNTNYIDSAKKQWGREDINWRTVTSYDALKVFTKAIDKIIMDKTQDINRTSKAELRMKVLQQLKEIDLNGSETSGFGVKFSQNKHSNTYRKYCVVTFKKGKFNKEKLNETEN
jgi:ABC-type branched-subunit amino acid transport system substrate-binding protein